MSSNKELSTSFKPFFIKLGVFSVFALGIVYVWQQYTTDRYHTDLGWIIVLFFISAAIFTHVTLAKAAISAPQKFIMYFMTITGVRLFGYLTIILIYAVIKREAALGFTLLFLLQYFIFSAFEAITLLKLFKK